MLKLGFPDSLLKHHLINCEIFLQCSECVGYSQCLVLKPFFRPAGVQQMPSNPSDSPLQAENAPSCYMALFRSAEAEQMTALDAERLSHGVNNVLTAVTPRLLDFHNLLLKPPHVSFYI